MPAVVPILWLGLNWGVNGLDWGLATVLYSRLAVGLGVVVEEELGASCSGESFVGRCWRPARLRPAKSQMLIFVGQCFRMRRGLDDVDDCSQYAWQLPTTGAGQRRRPWQRFEGLGDVVSACGSFPSSLVVARQDGRSRNQTRREVRA